MINNYRTLCLYVQQRKDKRECMFDWSCTRHAVNLSLTTQFLCFWCRVFSGESKGLCGHSKDHFALSCLDFLSVILHIIMIDRIMHLSSCFCCRFIHYCGGTGVSGLTRALATLPPRWIQEPSVVRDRNGRPQEDPLAVHCFCVCSGGALLGDLGVSRSRERDLQSALSIYPRIFLCLFIVYHRIVSILCLLLYSAIC